VVLSWLHRLLNKPRPLSRSAQQRTLTLVALEDRTVPSFASAVTFPVGVNPRSVTVADFNNDGKSDLLVVNQGPFTDSTNQSSLSLLLGNGNGTFRPAVTTDVIGVNPLAAAVGDFNRDGKLDVALLNPSGPAGPAVEILFGNGDGSFQANRQFISLGTFAQSVAAGDFNGDGNLDLVTANGPNGTLSVLLGNGNGTFQPRIDLTVGGAPNVVAVADVNGDGRPDAVATAQLTNTVSVLLGRGNGTFAPPRAFAASGEFFGPTALAIGDVNGDGKVDLVTNSQSFLESPASQLAVLLGNGDGTFQDPILHIPDGGNSVEGSVVLGDFNDDGRMDAIVGGQSTPGEVRVFRGNGDGTFADFLFEAHETGGNDPEGLAAADLNGDGLVDLVAANAASNTVGVLINNTTHTTISADVNPAAVGQTVILTARVTGVNGIPTGSVTFRDGGGFVALGSAPVDATGTARLAVTFTDAGDHVLSAVYGGDSTFGVSISSDLTETVNGIATTTTLASSVNPAVSGQTVTLTATVNSQAGVPTGTVTFFDFDAEMGTAQVDSTDHAKFAVTFAAGTHSLTARFAGTGLFADSTSAPVTETVNRAATTVALASSVNPAVTGQAVTFTATMAAVAPGAGTPTGTVTFRDGSVVLGTVAVGAGGTATFTTSFAATGGHVITAVYNGDSNFVGSSQSLTEQVNAPTAGKTTTIDLLASANPAVVGQTVTFTATVRDSSGTGTPTGTVTFFVGNKVVARVTLDANGQASFTRLFSRAGRFTIRAVYGGDATFDASSQSLIEQVNR